MHHTLTHKSGTAFTHSLLRLFDAVLMGGALAGHTHVVSPFTTSQTADFASLPNANHFSKQAVLPSASTNPGSPGSRPFDVGLAGMYQFSNSLQLMVDQQSAGNLLWSLHTNAAVICLCSQPGNRLEGARRSGVGLQSLRSVSQAKNSGSISCDHEELATRPQVPNPYFTLSLQGLAESGDFLCPGRREKLSPVLH
ncbi:MAG: hypothetical protein HYR56_29510 [Acidobacteria bacterium]|nr:hypothetical protein [Acidobacteriota bacterium]MBI3421485.1 hypothetical protein [Acidobacteriota bacterium]